VRRERRRSSASEIPSRAASCFAAVYSSSERLIWVRTMVITSYAIVLSRTTRSSASRRPAGALAGTGPRRSRALHPVRNRGRRRFGHRVLLLLRFGPHAQG